MMQQEFSRWQAHALAAAESTLAIRWRLVNEEWLTAKADYYGQLHREFVDIRALRKSAKRLHDLQQQRGVLARELEELPQ